MGTFCMDSGESTTEFVSCSGLRDVCPLSKVAGAQVDGPTSMEQCARPS